MRVKKTSARAKKVTAASKSRPARGKTTAPKVTAVAKSGRPVVKRKVAKRKTSRRAPVSIPPILLEGDQTTFPIVSGPGEKFALGPTPPTQHFDLESAELPEAYGTKRLHLTARDPHWLYANWDLTREQQLRYNKQSVDGHLILRIYANAVSGRPVSEIHVHPESRHWFANVEEADARYAGEIGIYRKGRKWTSIATSGPTLTLPETTSSDASAEFATIPMDLPFEKLVALVAQAAREHRPLAQAVEELRDAGHPDLPYVATAPITPWTPEQERALAAIVNLDQVQRVWIGSLEITELVRRQLKREVSSVSLARLPSRGAGFGQPTSPGGAVAGVSSPSKGEGEGARGKGFWFNVNAELIVYGATEPNASVTIGGRRIRLRPDGSFAYRFSLPDGRYDLPVVAVSEDETDGRAAELRFTRATEHLGDVGAHPQDPALKPPTPDNV